MKPLLINCLIGLVLLATRLPAAEKPSSPTTDGEQGCHVDGIHTISAAASAGGAEKRSLMLGVGMGEATWFDDVSVTSITVPK